MIDIDLNKFICFRCKTKIDYQPIYNASGQDINDFDCFCDCHESNCNVKEEEYFLTISKTFGLEIKNEKEIIYYIRYPHENFSDISNKFNNLEEIILYVNKLENLI